MNCKDAGTDRNQPMGIIGSTDLKLTVSNPWFVRMDKTALHEAIAMRDIHKDCQFGGYGCLVGVLCISKKKDSYYPISSVT